MQQVFFTFAIASALLSYLYWITFDILKPNMYMPFAANEIGEWAMFLLLGSSLVTGLPIGFSSVKKEVVFSCIMAAANTALWIGWNGEWVQDIVTGLCIAYYLCCLAVRLRYSETCGKTEKILAYGVCTAAVTAQAVCFAVQGTAYDILNIASYVIMLACILCFTVKTILALKNRETANASYRSFIVFICSIIAMYMSADLFYDVFVICSAISFLLMYMTVRKEVEVQ